MRDTIQHQACKRLLMSAEGQHLLAAVRARTVDRSVMPAAAGDGQSMAMLMAFREGENNLCRWLESLAQPEQNTQDNKETTHD